MPAVGRYLLTASRYQVYLYIAPEAVIGHACSVPSQITELSFTGQRFKFFWTAVGTSESVTQMAPCAEIM